MSEESDLERTEPPSDRKLEKAREDGNVPRSKELATFTVLMAAGGGLWFSGAHAIDKIKNLLRASLTFDRAQLYDIRLLANSTWDLLVELFIAFAPMAVIIMFVASASPILIGGWNFSTKSFMPNFGKLNPLSGLSNLFSKKSLIELLKAIGKTIIVGFVAYTIISKQIPELLKLSIESIPSGTKHLSDLLWYSFFGITGALGLIAAVDAPYQLKSYTDSLKMTREELKQEAKEAEGDPHIKAKIRQQQREISRRRMMSEIPNADVVVVNPTHFAVALKYSPDGKTAPKVVAKGSDVIAAKIREIATENAVPILSAPPLARALHKHTEIGDEIPQTLYTAVAQVLAYVFQLRDYKKSGGLRPSEPTNIEVPPDLDPYNVKTDDSK